MNGGGGGETAWWFERRLGQERINGKLLIRQERKATQDELRTLTRRAGGRGVGGEAGGGDGDDFLNSRQETLEKHYEKGLYAPEVHIMYLTVSSWFLMSFVMGGMARAGRLSSFMHLLSHPPQYGPWNPPRGLLGIKPPMHLWFIQPCA